MKHPFFAETLKAVALLQAAALLWGCTGFKAAVDIPRYYPGAYEGAGQGFRGPVYLLVHIGAAGITAVEILEYEDDEQIGGAAMEELLALVMDADTPEVDGVSGATGSSAGFLSALEDALNQARMPGVFVDGPENKTGN
jgi:fumarate reductase flavoprotein subunit